MHCQIKTAKIMVTTLTAVTWFWVNTLMWMCALAVAISAVNAIHFVFIPLCQRGSVGSAILLTLLVIVKDSGRSLTLVVAAVAGFFLFLAYGTFTFIRTLVTKNV